MKTPINAKHTPAPWKTRKGFGHGEIDVFHPDRSIKKPCIPTELAIVQINDDTKESIAESRANARLIAAAPEMVAELIQCEAILSLGPWNGTLDRVREVLTKALGPDWQNAEVSRGDGSASLTPNQTSNEH